jgi:hypothetical protein
MVTLLQAYDQVGDMEAAVTAHLDQRWQLVLGCLDAAEAPKFRERMTARDHDR